MSGPAAAVRFLDMAAVFFIGAGVQSGIDPSPQDLQLVLHALLDLEVSLWPLQAGAPLILRHANPFLHPRVLVVRRPLQMCCFTQGSSPALPYS